MVSVILLRENVVWFITAFTVLFFCVLSVRCFQEGFFFSVLPTIAGVIQSTAGYLMMMFLGTFAVSLNSRIPLELGVIAWWMCVVFPWCVLTLLMLFSLVYTHI